MCPAWGRPFWLRGIGILGIIFHALPLLIGVPRSAETEQVAELAGAGVVGSLLSQGCAKFIDISERHKSDAENRIVSLNTHARVCAWAVRYTRSAAALLGHSSWRRTRRPAYKPPPWRDGAAVNLFPHCTMLS